MLVMRFSQNFGKMCKKNGFWNFGLAPTTEIMEELCLRICLRFISYFFTQNEIPKIFIRMNRVKYVIIEALSVLI